jgi:hypothetical protein
LAPAGSPIPLYFPKESSSLRYNPLKFSFKIYYKRF